jgi:hypothetical protein
MRGSAVNSADGRDHCRKRQSENAGVGSRVTLCVGGGMASRWVRSSNQTQQEKHCGYFFFLAFFARNLTGTFSVTDFFARNATFLPDFVLKPTATGLETFFLALFHTVRRGGLVRGPSGQTGGNRSDKWEGHFKLSIKYACAQNSGLCAV